MKTTRSHVHSPAAVGVSVSKKRCLSLLIALGAWTGASGDTSIYEPYAITTLAGAAGTSGPADGTGAAAEFNQPWGVAVASNGTVYVADALNHTIRKITPAGVVTLLAGTPGSSGFADSPSAPLFARPTGVAVDAAGNVYVADYNNQRIRKITAAGVVSTLAGSATGLVGTNDGTGAAAEFHNPFGVALNSTATLPYVSDQNNQTIRQITLPGGVVTTYAGISGGGYSNGPKASALFNTPKGIAVDSAGNVYVADTGNMVVRKIAGGVVSTLAGDPATAFLAGYNDGAGSGARFSELATFSPFGGPCGIAVDSDGYVYVTDQGNPASLRGHMLRKITPGGSVTTLAGTVSTPGAANGTGAGAGFRFPGGVAVDGAGKLYVADTLNHTIRVGTSIAPCVVGVTWTPHETDRYWTDVTSSADGTKLATVIYSGMIYTSSDSGVNWTARDSNRNWTSIASSADGSKLVAGAAFGQIYTSTDSGVTWTARDSSRDWQCVASSADGSKLVAGTAFGQIYTSTDSGVTWTARDSSRLWYAVASSADGSRLVAATFGGQIYTSADFGANWTARDSNRSWHAVASSADGIKLVAADFTTGRLYTSTDSGVNWTARQTNQVWVDVASSEDGTKLVALVYNGLIYISTDSGVTWTPRASSRKWRAVASSADGEKLVAAVDSGKIYTSACAGPPVVYGGLDHLPLGDASVGKLGDDLIVGNLGSSGLDGIEIDMGPPAEKTLNLHYEVPAGNGTMTFTSHGDIDGVPEQPIGACTVTHNGGEETFSFNFSFIGASTYTTKIYSGKTLMYERTGNSGIGYRKQKLAPLPVEGWQLGCYYGDNLEYYAPSWMTMTSASIVPYEVEGGPTVMGDRVVISPDSAMMMVEVLSGGRIQASGAIPQIKIVQEHTQLNHAGLPHRTLGDARLTPLSVDTTDPVGYNRLAISNLGSSGQGGFMVILSDIPVFAKRPPCTDFAMQWDKVDADGMLPNGAVLKMGSWPYIGPFYPYPPVPPGVMALVQVAKVGAGSYRITTDLPPSGAGSRTVRLYHNGMLVTEVLDQTGPEVAMSSTFNTSFACHSNPGSVSLGFVPATNISIGGGASFACDQCFINYGSPITGFPAAVQITAEHIPDLTIKTENVLPFILHATRLPNAMGPAGTTLSIQWLGSGRLQESGNLMDWTDVPGATASPVIIFSNDSKHNYKGIVTLVR